MPVDYETYMIMYNVIGSDGKVCHGLFMQDEETVKVFKTVIEANEAARELARFMNSCNISCNTRILGLVAI